MLTLAPLLLSLIQSPIGPPLAASVRPYPRQSVRLALDKAEQVLIASIGGERAATYGEMTPVGFRNLARCFDLDADDVFLDLGSGDGGLVLQAAEEFGAGAIGIELAGSRHATALDALSKAPEGVRERVSFLCGDAAGDGAADILATRATVVYCANLLMDDALNQRFAERLAAAGPQLRGFALLLPFSDGARGFVRAQEPCSCGMSWDIHGLDHPCPVYWRE